ncbi:hypothetical protein DCS_03234 [Drechmeria coniospora]|uniref:Uncharacterized protein n=1 Tax=Drechmeria coniospora TaxID=98403 RepID=A0A151GYA1_DRECN|nr:hypothetical protein DCS_03234 [Drechmeria coniospora]KYK62089.1 hypothetical protein DCS_03234 [Drechmeria coniospora]
MEGRLHRLLLACLLFCQWISARPLSDASFVDGSDESPSIGLSFLPGPRHEGDVFTTGAKPIPAGQADGDELDHGPSYVSTTESFEVASRFALMANALGKRRIEDASTEPLVREGNSPAEASGGSSASQNDGNATAIPATASDAARVFLTKPDGRYIYVGNSDKFGRGGELAALHGIPHDRIIGVVYLDDPELKITFNPHYNHAYDSQVAGGDDSELVVELQPDPVSGLQHGPLDKVTPESKNKATKRTLSALNIVQAAELEAARLRQESVSNPKQTPPWENGLHLYSFLANYGHYLNPRNNENTVQDGLGGNVQLDGVQETTQQAHEPVEEEQETTEEEEEAVEGEEEATEDEEEAAEGEEEATEDEEEAAEDEEEAVEEEEEAVKKEDEPAKKAEEAAKKEEEPAKKEEEAVKKEEEPAKKEEEPAKREEETVEREQNAAETGADKHKPSGHVAAEHETHGQDVDGHGAAGPGKQTAAHGQKTGERAPPATAEQGTGAASPHAPTPNGRVAPGTGRRPASSGWRLGRGRGKWRGKRELGPTSGPRSLLTKRQNPSIVERGLLATGMRMAARTGGRLAMSGVRKVASSGRGRRLLLKGGKKLITSKRGRRILAAGARRAGRMMVSSGKKLAKGAWNLIKAAGSKVASAGRNLFTSGKTKRWTGGMGHASGKQQGTGKKGQASEPQKGRGWVPRGRGQGGR